MSVAPGPSADVADVDANVTAAVTAMRVTTSAALTGRSHRHNARLSLIARALLAHFLACARGDTGTGRAAAAAAAAAEAASARQAAGVPTRTQLKTGDGTAAQMRGEVEREALVRTPDGTLRVDVVSAGPGLRWRRARGIQYAQHPVGELRWQPPKPTGTWEGVRDARTFGDDCINAPWIYRLVGIEFNSMSESCVNCTSTHDSALVAANCDCIRCAQLRPPPPDRAPTAPAPCSTVACT